MKLPLLLSVLLFFSFTCSWAQTDNNEQTVYFKDGGLLKGNILTDSCK